MQLPTTSKYTLNLLDKIHEAILEHFDYNLSPKQLQVLLNYQSKTLIKNLIDTDGDPVHIDTMINDISKIITGGLDYPFNGATEHYKKRFFIKMNIRKMSYFERVFRFK